MKDGLGAAAERQDVRTVADTEYNDIIPVNGIGALRRKTWAGQLENAWFGQEYQLP